MGDHKSDDRRHFTSAATLLTVLTNVIVTSMITFYLIRARRSLSQVLPSKSLRLYTGVVTLLIESALPLTIFGIMFAIVTLWTPKDAYCYAVYLVLSSVSSLLFYAFTVCLPLIITFCWVLIPSHHRLYPRI